MTSPWAFRTLAFLLAPFLCIPAPESETSVTFDSLMANQTGLTSPHYLKFSPRGLSWCAKECKRRSKCLSFVYKWTGLECMLYSISRSEGADSVNDPGLAYSEIADWPSDMIGLCDSRPCLASQRCVTSVQGSALCVLTECAANPTSVTNAILPTTFEREIGSMVTYMCRSTHTTNGNSSVFCQSSGQWSLPTFNCALTGK